MGYWKALYRIRDTMFPLLSTVEHVAFFRGTRGWGCDMQFRVQTRTQYTMVEAGVVGYGPEYWRGTVGILASLLDAYRRARRHRREMRELPGDFDLAA